MKESDHREEKRQEKDSTVSWKSEHIEKGQIITVSHFSSSNACLLYEISDF